MMRILALTSALLPTDCSMLPEIAHQPTLHNPYFFQDDARFGGWQNYLLRSDDFIRFCCRMHIWEMLTARGGAGETRVVWRWKKIR